MVYGVYRVYGNGFSSGLALMVKGFGLRVWGGRLMVKVMNSKAWVLGLRSTVKVPAFEFRV